MNDATRRVNIYSTGASLKNIKMKIVNSYRSKFIKLQYFEVVFLRASSPAVRIEYLSGIGSSDKEDLSLRKINANKNVDIRSIKKDIIRENFSKLLLN